MPKRQPMSDQKPPHGEPWIDIAALQPVTLADKIRGAESRLRTIDDERTLVADELTRLRGAK